MVVLAAAATAHAADPFEIRHANGIRVHLQINLPTFLASLHTGLALGDAAAVGEPRAIEINVLAQAIPDPSPMDRLAQWLQRSPFDVADSGPSKPGVRLDLFSPGDIGVSIKYRW